MVDRLTPQRRSWLMSRVRGRDTTPEMKVRKSLSALGYRYRLYRMDLPGKPDLVFPGRKKAIFVHGCYWHGHRCRYGRLSKSRTEYWRDKIETNRARDRRNLSGLKKLGWKTLVVWQCQLKDLPTAVARMVDFLA